MGAFSTSFLEALSPFLLWVAAGTGAIAVFATLFSALAANEVSGRIQRIADEKIAHANATAAEANEKVAQANRDAEHARLETQRLRGKLAWRTLSPMEAAALRAGYSPSRFKMIVIVPGGDPERDEYGHEIAQALGVNVGPPPPSSGGSNRTAHLGLYVTSIDLANCEAVVSIFKLAGIEVANLGLTNITRGAPTMLFVGSKPRIT